MAQSIEDYNTAQSRAEKFGIVETIMDEIFRSGGRFLKEEEVGNWQEMEPEKVRQKIAHAIRDTTKKIEARRARAAQLAGGVPPTVPPQPARPAPVTASSRSDSGISTLMQGLDEYRKGMDDYQQGIPLRAVTADDDVKMPPVAGIDVALSRRPQKRTLGRGTGEGTIFDAVPRAQKEARNERRHTTTTIGDPKSHNIGLDTSLDTRYELRRDDSRKGTAWEPDPLRPCLLYTSPSPRDQRGSRMPSSA